MHIKNAVVLVTGANRGLGRAFVNAILEAGAAKIYAAARDPGTITQLGKVCTTRCDAPVEPIR